MQEIEGWLIGDGTKIYLCDFFLGTIYTDIFSNGRSWLSPKERNSISSKFPKFMSYGDRFMLENAPWLDKREKATG